MATFTGNQAGTEPAKNNHAGVLHVAYGQVSVTANPADGDIYELLKIPAGSLVVGGEFWSTDIDTGTEVLDIDIGWAANGGGSETFVASDGTTWTNAGGTADPDGFSDMGVLLGDAITSEPRVAAGTGNYRRFEKFTAGPKYFSRETTVQAEGNVAANAFTAGSMWARVEYLVLSF